MSNISITPDLKGYSFDDYRNDIWGDSFNWSFNRTLSQVVKLVIHHSVTNTSNKSARQQAQDIALLHKARGWAGIGYHFVIARDGTVLYVGDIGQGRVNVANNNEKVIGICLAGDFTKELPSAHQILAANRLCDFFLFHSTNLPNIKSWDDVWGHKDCTAWPGSEATICPSPAWRDQGDALRNRIISGNYKGYPDRENAKGVELVPTPTPQPTPNDPEPTPTPVPDPIPEPTPPTPPQVITEPSQRVLVNGVELELRQINEIMTNLEATLEAHEKVATRDAAVKAIIDSSSWFFMKYFEIKKLYDK